MKILKLISIVFFIPLCCSIKSYSQNAEWQWSAPVQSVISEETKDHPVAYLYIPPICRQVRGVVVGQHNMIEEGIFEHPAFRKMLSDLGFAVVWITPNLSVTFDFNNRVGEQFNEMMKSLAEVSGYSELEYAPIVPLGHSALASYPWNFAAWNPARTLAAISIHGDAPLTKLTGSGRPNPDWGNRTIEGVPGLMVMGEYEWWEDRIAPGFDYVSKHPKAPITFFADAGHGHFDYSDEMIEYVCLYISKVAKYRLPKNAQLHQPVELKKINPENGWLMDRWHKDSLPSAKSASYKKYKGNRHNVSWVFDKGLANATEDFYTKARGKKSQYIGFVQNGQMVKPTGGHANYSIPFIPLADGISFRIKAFFADTSKVKVVNEFSSTPLAINRICGPVKKLNDSTFQLSFYRMGYSNPKRSNDVWLLASNKGDTTYKSAVQQLDMHFPLINKEGKEQHISFAKIDDQKAGFASLNLNAVSDANVPVYYYVKEGPAIINDNQLIFTIIPPRSKFPVKVTVVAWQYGNSNEPKLQSAIPVEQSFYIVK